MTRRVVVGSRLRPRPCRRLAGSVKTGSESVLDDGRELHNTANAAAAADGILRSALPTELTALIAAADSGFETYRLATGLAEAARLRTLLTDPLSTIGPDPLPVPRETFPLQRLAHSSEPLTDEPPRRVRGLQSVRMECDGTHVAEVLA